MSIPVYDLTQHNEGTTKVATLLFESTGITNRRWSITITDRRPNGATETFTQLVDVELRHGQLVLSTWHHESYADAISHAHALVTALQVHPEGE